MPQSSKPAPSRVNLHPMSWVWWRKSPGTILGSCLVRDRCNVEPALFPFREYRQARSTFQSASTPSSTSITLSSEDCASNAILSVFSVRFSRYTSRNGSLFSVCSYNKFQKLKKKKNHHLHQLWLLHWGVDLQGSSHYYSISYFYLVFF